MPQWLSLLSIQGELEQRGYVQVPDNDPGCCTYRSPVTRRPIVIPLGEGDKLPESLVRHIMKDEPDADVVLNSIRERDASE